MKTNLVFSKIRTFLRNVVTFWELPKMEAFAFEQWIPNDSKVLLFDYGSLNEVENLAKKGCKIVLASRSEGKILYAKQKLSIYENVMYKKIDDLMNLPFKSGLFDIVVLDFLSHKISSKKIGAFTKQIKNVLKSNGLIIHLGEGYPAPILQVIVFLPRLFLLLLAGYAPYFYHDIGKVFRKEGIKVSYRKGFFVGYEALVGKT